MNDRNQPDFTPLSKQGWLMRRTRILIMVVAMCSLSVGIGIGAIVRGTSSATGDDHRLTITSGAPSGDSLSATFARVAEQVEPLKKLVEVRKQLSALLAKTDGNDKLAEKLQEIIGNTELQQKIGKEAGLGTEGGSQKEG